MSAVQDIILKIKADTSGLVSSLQTAASSAHKYFKGVQFDVGEKGLKNVIGGEVKSQLMQVDQFSKAFKKLKGYQFDFNEKYNSGESLRERYWQAKGALAGYRQQIIRTLPQLGELTKRVSIHGLEYKKAGKNVKNTKEEEESFGDALRKRVVSGFKAVEKSSNGIFTAMGNVGRQLSWFGFRLTMMGRMMTRFVMKPINKAINLFQNWEKTMTDVGIGMGFLMATGNMTGEMFEMMQNAMVDAPQVGMQLQGLFGAIAAFLIEIGADILPVLIPKIIELINVLWDLWKANKQGVIDTINKLSGEALGKLIDVLIKTGGAFINNLVSGLQLAWDWAGKFLDKVEPYIPTFLTIMGLLMGLSPLMSTLGTILFAISVPLQALGWSFGMLSGMISSVVGLLTGGGLISTLGVLGLAIATVALLMTTLGEDGKKVFDKLVDYASIAVDWLMAEFEKIDWNAVFNTMWENFNYVADLVLSYAGNVATDLLNWFATIDWNEAFSSLDTFMGRFGEWLIERAQDLGASFRAWLDTVNWSDVFYSLGSFLGNFGVFLFQFAGTVLSAIYEFLKTAFGDAWNDVLGDSEQTWQDKLIALFKAIIEGLSTTLGSFLKGIVDAIAEAFGDGIDAYFSGILTRIETFIQDILNNPWVKKFLELFNIDFELPEMPEIPASATVGGGGGDPIKNTLEDQGGFDIMGTLDQLSKLTGSTGLGIVVDVIKDIGQGWNYIGEATGGAIDAVNSYYDSSAKNINLIEDLLVKDFYVANVEEPAKKVATVWKDTFTDVTEQLTSMTTALNTQDNFAGYIDGTKGGAASTDLLNKSVARVADEFKIATYSIADAQVAVKNYTTAQDELEQSHITMYARSIGTDILRNMTEATYGYEMAQNAVKMFNEEMAKSTSTAIGYSPDAPVFIGPITLEIQNDFSEMTLNSEMDLDILTDEVSRRIASAIDEVITR